MLVSLIAGKIFTKEELEYIGSVCKKHNVIILSDEVYERVVFDDNEHVRIASLPGMNRIIILCKGWTLTDLID